MLPPRYILILLLLYFADYQFKQFYERTQVEFGDLSEEVISEYVKTGEPL